MVSRWRVASGSLVVGASFLAPVLVAGPGQAASPREPARRYVSSHAYYHALRAELAFARQDLKTAAEELQLALVYDPESVLLTERLARLALSTGQLNKARRLVDRARVLAPRQAQLLVLDAEVATQAGDFGRAERVLRQAVGQAPTKVEPSLALATHVERRGRRCEAVRILSRAAARMPGAPEPLDALGALEDRRGRLARAVRAYERAVRRAPDGFVRRTRLDHLYARLGRYKDAVEGWRRFVRRGPREAEALAYAVRAEFRAGETDRGRELLARWRILAPGDATELAIAMTLATEGYFAEAVSTWENRRVPTTLPEKSAMAYGRALLEVGRIQDAVGVLGGIGSDSSDFAKARLMMATALVRRGAVDRAEQVLDRALRFEPDNLEFGLRLGMLRPALGQAPVPESVGRLAERATRLARGLGLQAADAFIDAFFAERPDRPGGEAERTSLRAELWIRHADEVPLAVLQAALDAEPNSVRWRAAVAAAVASSGRGLRTARRHAEGALALAPDDPGAVVAVGVVSLRRGARRHAEECLERAVRLSPGSMEAWESWGEVLTVGGMASAAQAAYTEARRALASDPWRGTAAKRAASDRLKQRAGGGRP